jgi:hypothetical protein
LDILTMHLPINVKSPNNISKWQMGFNSAFKGLNQSLCSLKWIHCRNLQLIQSDPKKMYTLFDMKHITV